MKLQNFSEKFKNSLFFNKEQWHVKKIHYLKLLAMPLQFYSTNLALIFAVGWILRDAEDILLFF